VPSRRQKERDRTISTDAIRCIRSQADAVERTVQKPHTGSRSDAQKMPPERLGARPRQRQRAARACEAPGGKAPEVETGGERLRRPERGIEAQGSNGPCIASALRAKAIAGPVDRRERLVRGAKAQKPHVSSPPPSRRLVATTASENTRGGASEPNGRWARGVETRSSPAGRIKAAKGQRTPGASVDARRCVRPSRENEPAGPVRRARSETGDE
jgi:hypothetical protein